MLIKLHTFGECTKWEKINTWRGDYHLKEREQISLSFHYFPFYLFSKFLSFYQFKKMLKLTYFWNYLANLDSTNYVNWTTKSFASKMLLVKFHFTYAQNLFSSNILLFSKSLIQIDEELAEMWEKGLSA